MSLSVRFPFTDELMHYGTPRHSGRYPYGSGDDPYQHGGKGLLGRANAMKAEGKSETEIAKTLNMSTGELRALRSSAKDAIAADQYRQWSAWREKGMSISAIAERSGAPWSTVKRRLETGQTERVSKINSAMDMLKDAVEEKKYVDVGPGTGERLDLNASRLNTAVSRLCDTGKYSKVVVPVKQVGTGKTTNVSVLVKNTGLSKKEQWADVMNAAKNLKVRLVDGYQVSEGRTVRNLEPPVSIDSKRVKVNYAEDGGTDKDGVIELRRNVPDLSLGSANYAQVRIAVDGTHYLKGMAMYSDDMPKGVDVIFNTNKHKGVPKCGPDGNTVLKLMKDDPDNPFGATIKPSEQLVKAQRYYTGKDGKQHQSAINIVNEEGDWERWSKSLSGQFLSKQSPKLVAKQLNLTLADKKAEFQEIQSVTNPTVKKVLLDKFAESCDYDAVHLKAAALPRQSSHVILPAPNLKPNEIHATNYRQGEQVVLVRYPHGGKFEIPQLRVNNNNKSVAKILGNAPDAVGIHPKVAGILSGADFDGDTVLVIPVNSRVKIERQRPLEGLKDFEPKEKYKGYEGMKVMGKRQTQTEMGKISNLITDMTIKGADEDELARAVRHSMVVIDARKHKLDYQASYRDNNINQLKAKYQANENGKVGGASTLLSRAKSRQDVPERKDYVKINPKTGEKIYSYTNATKRRKINGKWVQTDEPKMERSTKMAETSDARTLMSREKAPVERLYANYANSLKAMGNQARRLSVTTSEQKRSATARTAYANEVASLESKHKDILRRRPLERQAQMIANNTIASVLNDHPEYKDDGDRMKKVRHQALSGARYRVSGTAKKPEFKITDREWEAIQAGAVSPTALRSMMQSADIDSIREKATPRPKRGISNAKATRIKAMMASGNYTQSEVADLMGVSVSSVRAAISE